MDWSQVTVPDVLAAIRKVRILAIRWLDQRCSPGLRVIDPAGPCRARHLDLRANFCKLDASHQLIVSATFPKAPPRRWVRRSLHTDAGVTCGRRTVPTLCAPGASSSSAFPRPRAQTRRSPGSSATCTTTGSPPVAPFQPMPPPRAQVGVMVQRIGAAVVAVVHAASAAPAIFRLRPCLALFSARCTTARLHLGALAAGRTMLSYLLAAQP